MPKLFTKEEFNVLKKSSKKIILEAIQYHQLVRKTDAQKSRRGLQKTILETDRKQIPLRVYQRSGIAWTEYSYPFVPSGVVTKSTKVSVTPEFPKETQTILIPTNLERISFLSSVVAPGLLRHNIAKVRPEHLNRIRTEYRSAVEIRKPQHQIDKIRRYFQRFYPFEFLAMENLIRQKAGIVPMTDTEAMKPIKVYRARKQNANTFMPKKRKKGT